MSAEPSTVSFLSPLLTGVIGLAGVLAGGWISLYGKSQDRRDSAAERIRQAYIDWYASLENITETESLAILVRCSAGSPSSQAHLDVAKDLAEEMKRLSRRLSELSVLETTAFARLILLDYGSAELGVVNRIRTMKPGHTVMERARQQGELPSHHEFLRLEQEQAQLLGILARDVCRRFALPKRRYIPWLR